jgi:hypothetical protein
MVSGGEGRGRGLGDGGPPEEVDEEQLRTLFCGGLHDRVTEEVGGGQ